MARKPMPKLSLILKKGRRRADQLRMNEGSVLCNKNAQVKRATQSQYTASWRFN